MKKVINELKYWSQVLLLPVYGLSFLFPRNKRIWLFGSTFGRRFADNPRYLYTYLQNKKSNIRPIWITRNLEIFNLLKKNNLEVYMSNSLKGFWFALRGGVYIYDNYSKDINFWLSGNALKFNTWHGIPLKMIQMDNKFDHVRHPKNTLSKLRWVLRRLSDEKPTDYVLTTSDYLKNIFASAFATPNVVVSGYPRVDLLNGNLENNIFLDSEKKIYESMLENKKNNIKNIIYMPTFRDSESEFFEVIQIKSFLDFLKYNNMSFYVKLHPKSKNLQRFKSIKQSNLIVVDKDSDPYTYLCLTDILITDYSSIYFDYLVTDKPIIFFPYDLNTYLKESRQMYFSYDEITPGHHVTTMEELVKAIKDILIDNVDNYVNDRKEVKKTVFNDCSIVGSQALAKVIETLL
ncbi:CDP-glycerol glycerophosphotransferase family protein [Anaerocolumna sp. AGMB13025]|uniref:CDP-glycerol glycerophosphotransferase family protein n=1 Tax=Anaerocolumna sp. AGMB13025 TaxID=3039116 RepID=UPI00241CEE89|nr:CDP-glycerol glycerophosphotransferase family protein [Anaerocolumna sp. AGMB13025]WFR56795.1 CDP-glycerol glycerophosphotransferase family protein [Anaerocolumna sp. AGMB13025]